MLELEQVKELAATMIAKDITTLEVKGRDYALRLVRSPGAVPVVSDATRPRHDRVQILSPATGQFCSRGDDDGLAALDRGAEVLAGEPLGYVGIGPVRLLCVSPAAGRLAGRMPSQGQAVGAGDTLFTLETRA